MQAYARAELTPLESERRLASVPALMLAGPDVDHGARMAFDNAATPSSILASLMLQGLDENGLAALARRLAPHLSGPVHSETSERHLAYTVASLAIELGVSQKAIRCAIARGELSAVKRGSRWIISANAVQTWATASECRRGSHRSVGVVAPKAAGPSLRSVLCGDAERGGRR